MARGSMMMVLFVLALFVIHATAARDVPMTTDNKKGTGLADEKNFVSYGGIGGLSGIGANGLPFGGIGGAVGSGGNLGVGGPGIGSGLGGFVGSGLPGVGGTGGVGPAGGVVGGVVPDMGSGTLPLP